MSAPAVDERVRFQSWGRPCLARLRAWPDRRVAVLTEQADNLGPSITNAAEAAWPAVLAGHLDVLASADGGPWRLVEHYSDGESYGVPAAASGRDRLTEVRFDGNGEVSWHPLPDDLAWLRDDLS